MDIFVSESVFYNRIINEKGLKDGVLEKVKGRERWRWKKTMGRCGRTGHGLLWQEIHSLTCQHRQMANPELTQDKAIHRK